MGIARQNNTVAAGRQQPPIYRIDSIGGASDFSSTSDNDEHLFHCGSSGSHDDDVPYLERSLAPVKVFNLAWTDFPCEDEIQEAAERGWCVVMDVGEPVTITTKNGLFPSTFTTYLIKVETSHHTFPNSFNSVRRRFAEFVWLRNELEKRYKDSSITIPELPPKSYLPFMTFNPTFIQERLRGLSIFMFRLLQNPIFLQDDIVSFFLESPVSIQEVLEENRLKKGNAKNAFLSHSSFSSVSQSTSSSLSSQQSSSSSYNHVDVDTL